MCISQHNNQRAITRVISGLRYGSCPTVSKLSWDAPTHATAGNPITIGLRWQAPRALDQALFPEIQILNADGQPIALSLAAPQDGFYPTWRWRPGEQRRIQLPPDLAPGVYQVAARVHNFAAGRALEVPGSLDGRARIGEIVAE